ncbi:hypothetical protein ACWCL1_08875 [Ligilactobacillus sp. LYQ135]
MSEPYDLIEQELQIIAEIQTLADEQRDIKSIHRNNVKSIRAWRINWKKNAERVSKAHTGILDEDEWNFLNNQIKAINIQIRSLDGLELKNKHSYKEFREKVTDIQSYIKSVCNQIADKESHYKSGEAAYVALEKYANKILDEYELVMHKRQQIVQKNKVIAANNAKEEDYYRQAAETVRRINRKLGALSSDGQYAGFNEQGEVILIDPNKVSQEWAYRIIKANQDGFNIRSLNGLPSELQDMLFEMFKEDEDYSQDNGLIASKIAQFINANLSGIPEKPKIEYQEKEKVPELPLLKINLNDIFLDELSVKLINKSNSIPENILEELEGYAQGKFSNTAKNADRINEIATKYGTLKLMIEPEDKQSVRAINKKIRELKDIYGQFGSERNSAKGSKLINNLVSATSEFLAHTRNQQRVFDQYYEEFNLAVTELKNWINQAWWQAGGQPDNHQKAGKNDHSERTYVSRTSNTAYKGESL